MLLKLVNKKRFSAVPKIGLFLPINAYVPQELVYLTNLNKFQQRLISTIGVEELLSTHVPPFDQPVTVGETPLSLSSDKFKETKAEAVMKVTTFRNSLVNEKEKEGQSAGEQSSEDQKFTKRSSFRPSKQFVVGRKAVTFDPFLHNKINRFQPNSAVFDQNSDELSVQTAIQYRVSASLSRIDFYDFAEGKFNGKVCRMEGIGSAKVSRVLEPNNFSLQTWIRGVLMGRISSCEANLATMRKISPGGQSDMASLQATLDSLKSKLDDGSTDFVLKSEDELWRRVSESGSYVVEYESVADNYQLMTKLGEAEYKYFVEGLGRLSASLKTLAQKTNFIESRQSGDFSATIERAAAVTSLNTSIALLFSKHVLSQGDLYYLTNEPDLLVRLEFVVETLRRFTAQYLESWTICDEKSRERSIGDGKETETKYAEDLYEQVKKYQEDGSPASKRALVDKVNRLLKSGRLNETVKKAVAEEVSRFGELSEHDSDYHNVKSYLELVLKMPYGRFTVDQTNLEKAKAVIEDSHFGMEEIKKRILQFLAVGRTKGSVISKKVLCLLGPPGVGKTSISRTIADCLGRKFVRVSLGGERDVSVIKGHRRTYIGAYPGKIVTALKMAGTENPVILLDEVDKVAQNGLKGNIQDTLLELLDPAQNHSFYDHYLDLPVDLSKVLFLCSANVLDSTTVTPALLDRMEVVELSGYTKPEKLAIVERHLVPKTAKKVGLERYNAKVEFPATTIGRIIDDYAREPGVRNLEKSLLRIHEKVALEFLKDNESAVTDFNSLGTKEGHQLPEKVFRIEDSSLKDYLGPKRFFSQTVFHKKEDLIGFAFGLGYNAYGGSVLSIEVLEVPQGTSGSETELKEDLISQIDNVIVTGRSERDERGVEIGRPESPKSEGSLVMTGSLGTVMKESVEIAYSFAKFYLYKLGKGDGYLESRTLHIHFPEGASKKDGPSAGITIVTALVSAATRIPYDPSFAMTGEVSLNGRVLKIGGLREKVLAAKREGIHKVIVPKGNSRDVEDMKADVREGVEFFFVEHYDEVFRLVFGNNGT